MKKMICIMSALALAFAFTACFDSDLVETTTSEETTIEETTEETEVEESEETEIDENGNINSIDGRDSSHDEVPDETYESEDGDYIIDHEVIDSDTWWSDDGEVQKPDVPRKVNLDDIKFE